MSDLLTLLTAPQPAGQSGRRASVISARPVVIPALPDLGGAPQYQPVVLPGDTVAEDPRFDAGWNAGHNEGLAAGRATAAAEAEAFQAAMLHSRVAAEQLVVSLAAAMDEVRRQQALAVDGLANELVDTALALASSVVGRNVAEGPAAADALVRALALVPSGASGTVRMHPDDLATLDTGTHLAVDLQPDALVERGGCIVDLPDASIDAQLGPALDRARAALLGDVVETW